jgi:hypothetical protein
VPVDRISPKVIFWGFCIPHDRRGDAIIAAFD